MPSQHESSFNEKTDGPPAPQEERLFAIIRGAYDEEGHGWPRAWNEQDARTAEGDSSEQDEAAIRRQEAELEAIREGRKHELRLVRDRFERRYTTWIPFSQAEMTLAVTGLTTKANKILSKVSPNVLSATENYYNAAKDYRNQAAIHHTNLMDAKILEQDLKPSVDKIRGTPEIRENLADYLYAQQSLERLQWGQKRGKRQSRGQMPREREYQEIFNSIGYKSEEQLIAIWERAVQCAYSRRDFWQLAIDNTENSNELVRAIKTEDQTHRS